MSIKTTAATALAVVALATGAAQALDPTVDLEENRRQQQVQDLSDADDNSKSRMREEGNDHLTSEQAKKNIPGAPRPPEPNRRPRIRIRF